MKVCYLHLGLHKTASSSFQQTCAANQVILREAGLLYPIFQCPQAQPPRLSINNHSVPLRSLYDKNPENYHINKRWKVKSLALANQHYAQQLDTALSTDHSLVLSGEGLSLLSLEALRRLVARIEAHGFLVKPWVVVRSPLDYAHSIAQQLVRGGQHLPLIGLGSLRPPRRSDVLTIPDGLREIRRLQAVFEDRLVVVPFRRACRHPEGPVGYLLKEFCQIQQLDSIVFKQTQESKSNLWVRLQNELNRRWPMFNQKKRLDPNYVRLKTQYSASGRFRLTRQELQLLSVQLTQSNRDLAALLGEEFVEASPEVSVAISNADLLDLLSDLLRSDPPLQDSDRRRA